MSFFHKSLIYSKLLIGKPRGTLSSAPICTHLPGPAHPPRKNVAQLRAAHLGHFPITASFGHNAVLTFPIRARASRAWEPTISRQDMIHLGPQTRRRIREEGNASVS